MSTNKKKNNQPTNKLIHEKKNMRFVIMIIYRRKGREREMRGGIKGGRGVAGPGLRKYASLRKDTKGRAGDEGERRGVQRQHALARGGGFG